MLRRVGRNLFGIDTVSAVTDPVVPTSTATIGSRLRNGAEDSESEKDFPEDDDVINKLLKVFVDLLPFVKQDPEAIVFCRTDLVNARNSATVKVYDSVTMSELIKQPNKLDKDEQNKDQQNKDKQKKDKQEKVILRYALTEQGEMRYGAEGVPSRRTAAHSQLICQETKVFPPSIRCHAAGNITLTDGKVVSISNKSGDFRPGVQSMQFALAAMLRDGVVFADRLTVEQHLFGAYDQYVGMYRFDVSLNYLKQALIDLGLSITPQEVVKSPTPMPIAALSELKRKTPLGECAENRTQVPLSKRRL